MSNSNDDASSLPKQADFDAIMASCLDYVDGWYNAEPERMRRCLHPDLVKRTIARDMERGELILRRPSTAEMMVAFTEEGGGTKVPETERVYQTTIVDIFRHIAMVKCVSPLYVDYLHLANFEDKGWLIVNVLWELREGEMEPDA